MSIYFFHTIQAYFGIIVYFALWNKHIPIKDFFIGVVIGGICAFASFKVANDFLVINELKVTSYFFASFLLIFLAFLFALHVRIFKIIIISSLIFCFNIYYRVISYDFQLFNGELLDTLSIISFGFVILGFGLMAFLYLLLRDMASKISNKIIVPFIIAMTVLLVLRLLADGALELMRFGVLETHAVFLSIVAKLIYYGSFLPYIYSFFVLCLVGFYLSALPKLPEKSIVGNIAFRKIKALVQNTFSVSKFTFAVLIAINGISLYYDFYASKPPKLSEAEIIEPINNEFKIPVKLLEDNKLHRFAYITDAGNKIRFFALNRFPDKLSPVAVFDACMICGDMGYIKNGDELICISCNVRIFLPSVGKEGGCNPIPFPYEFDGEYITIKLETIEKGVNYFNEIVEKEVTDPINGKKIINLKAPFSYMYGGKTYFFETEENYREFMKDPKQYATDFKQAYWRTQGFVALKESENICND
ncbi:MAG: Fe-S-containing protein [Campylobacteraceae bacterium]|jgi:uncharacterized membrane protein/YHS domain-containing protein|nr:Fe-S-containing protein [Campylobacteraceae bacterium]